MIEKYQYEVEAASYFYH